MTLAEQIQKEILRLPSEKQRQALDFIAFLGQRAVEQPAEKHQSLRQHPAFGSWRGRKIDALEYQDKLRSEWDARP
ncbi:MAG: DUF2281 domain-containing protein [Chloroflexi bacterium]|nr:DUF2281 domain-containing protein [Chloroflexota bacterium]